MKLSEALETWLKRAGIDIELSDVPEIDLPDGSDEKVNGLMNLQLAKTNKDVRNAYFQLFAKSTEKQLSKLIDAHGLEVALEVAQPIENKIESVFNALQEKQSTGTKPEKENQLNQRIAELTKQLNESKQNHELTIKSIHEEYSQKATNNFIEMQLSKLQYKEGLSANDMLFLAKNKLNKHLETLGAQIKIDGENVHLVQKDNPEAYTFDANGKQISFDDLIKTATSDLIQVQQTIKPIEPKGIVTNTTTENTPNVNASLIAKAANRLKTI
jgi:aspartyl-tRNA synthetase